MKTSEAILKGMERFPRQAFGKYQGDGDSACVLGCANWATSGGTETGVYSINQPFFRYKFLDEYGIYPEYLNDDHKFPRDVIAGMFAAIGD